MSGMKDQKKTKKFTKKAALICAALVALLIVCLVLTMTKPMINEVKSQISPRLIESAGNKYSETAYDYVIFNIARGSNASIKIKDVETYIGIAGQVYPANSGALSILTDMLFWLPSLLSGARITIVLTILSVLAGLIFSIFLALGKISKIWIVNKICSVYIFFFRGTPLLMQLFFIYLGLPQIHPALNISNKFLAAFLAFTLNTAAYCAEIIRAAIQSIDKGQMEASKALGMSYGQAMRLVIIPQSFRRLIPPVANEFIMVVKDVSLVSIIALTDLTQQTRQIVNSSSSALVFIPAMIIYLIITAFFTFVFNKLEKRFSIYA